jgi:CBS domain-containing protein
MKIGSYSSFNCGLIFPTSFFTQTPPFNAKTETPADAEITTSQPEDTKLESEKGPEPVSETPDQTTEQEQTPPPQQKQPPTAGQEQISPDDADQPPRGKVSEAIHKMLRSSAPPDGKSPRTVKIENAGLTDIPASSQGSAKDIMQKNIVWASPDDSVQQTLTKMQQTDSGYVMVGKEGSLDGIVSTSDIAAATSIYLKPMFAKWRRPMDDATLQIKIKWVMNKPIHTVKPDTSLASIMDNMSRAEIRCLPVLDEQNKVLGLITACDIFKTLMNTPSNK